MIILSFFISLWITIYQAIRIDKLRAQRDEAMRIAEESQRIAREALGLSDAGKVSYDVKIFNSHAKEVQSIVDISHAVIAYGHQNKEAN